MLLVVTEILATTNWLDTAPLAERPGVFAGAIGHSPAVLSILLAFGAALLVMAGPRLPLRVRSLANASAGTGWGAMLGLHVAAVLAFLVSSVYVFDPATAGVPLPSALAIVWMVFGLSALTTWLLAVAPGRAWAALAAQERRALAVSALAALGAWLAGRLAQVLWKPLADATFRLSRMQLEWLYTDVVADPQRRILGTPTFSVEIASSCSGYEGIGLIVVFVGLYLWLFRDSLRFPGALVLIPLSAALIWLFNTVRITALIAIGSSWSPDIAAGAFHSQAGWISFLTVALLVLAITHRVHLFARDRNTGRSQVIAPHADLAAGLLLPFVVLLGAGILTSAITSGLDVLYPLKVLAVSAVLWHFRHVYRRLAWSWSWHAVAIGIAVFALWIWLEPEREAPAALSTELAAVPAWLAAFWLIARIAGSTLIVPLAEELAFRGYLLRKLAAYEFETVDPRRFSLLAFVGSSLLFGLLHERWLAGTLAGMAYALALYRRGRLGDAVVAHGTTNALIAISVLGFGQWGLWN